MNINTRLALFATLSVVAVVIAITSLSGRLVTSNDLTANVLLSRFAAANQESENLEVVPNDTDNSTEPFRLQGDVVIDPTNSGSAVVDYDPTPNLEYILVNTKVDAPYKVAQRVRSRTLIKTEKRIDRRIARKTADINLEKTDLEARLSNAARTLDADARATQSPEDVQIRTLNALWTGATVTGLTREQIEESLGEKVDDYIITQAQPVFATMLDAPGIIDAPFAYDIVAPNGQLTTGAGVRVGVVDTGIDYTHPDFNSGCLGPGCRVAGGYDFVNEDADPIDDHGHGTHVAGIIGGNGLLINNGNAIPMPGVAPDVTFYAYKVLSASGSGSSVGVVGGIDACADPNGDGDPIDHLDICNMSLGTQPGAGSPDDPQSLAVDAAVDAGVAMIVAAGNSGPEPETIGSPGLARDALTVGAICKPDAVSGEPGAYCENNVARFSSRGPVRWYSSGTQHELQKPDVVAPGVSICAAQAAGTNLGSQGPCGDQHRIASGTSMATPVTAGMAALLKQLYPDIAPLELKELIMNTAVSVGNPAEPLIAQGSGAINTQNNILLNGVPSSSIQITGGLPLIVENDLLQTTQTIARTVTMKNLTSSQMSLRPTVMNQINGISLGFDQSVYTINAGQEVVVTITFTLDNTVVPEGSNIIRLLFADDNSNEEFVFATQVVGHQRVHFSNTAIDYLTVEPGQLAVNRTEYVEVENVTAVPITINGSTTLNDAGLQLLLDSDSITIPPESTIQIPVTLTGNTLSEPGRRSGQVVFENEALGIYQVILVDVYVGYSLKVLLDGPASGVVLYPVFDTTMDPVTVIGASDRVVFNVPQAGEYNIFALYLHQPPFNYVDLGEHAFIGKTIQFGEVDQATLYPSEAEHLIVIDHGELADLTTEEKDLRAIEWKTFDDRTVLSLARAAREDDMFGIFYVNEMPAENIPLKIQSSSFKGGVEGIEIFNTLFDAPVTNDVVVNKTSSPYVSKTITTGHPNDPTQDLEKYGMIYTVGGDVPAPRFSYGTIDTGSVEALDIHLHSYMHSGDYDINNDSFLDANDQARLILAYEDGLKLSPPTFIADFAKNQVAAIKSWQAALWYKKPGFQYESLYDLLKCPINEGSLHITAPGPVTERTVWSNINPYAYLYKQAGIFETGKSILQYADCSHIAETEIYNQSFSYKVYLDEQLVAQGQTDFPGQTKGMYSILLEAVPGPIAGTVRFEIEAPVYDGHPGRTHISRTQFPVVVSSVSPFGHSDYTPPFLSQFGTYVDGQLYDGYVAGSDNTIQFSAEAVLLGNPTDTVSNVVALISPDRNTWATLDVVETENNYYEMSIPDEANGTIWLRVRAIDSVGNYTEFEFAVDESTEIPPEPPTEIPGCTDPEALNYNSEATVDDGSCEYAEEPPTEIPGCTDPEALNYNSEATVDDGSCEYAPGQDITPPTAVNLTYLPGEDMGPRVGVTSDKISWTPSTDDVAIDGYRVFVNQSSGFAFLGQTTQLQWIVEQFAACTQFKVTAIDTSGNQSTESNIVTKDYSADCDVPVEIPGCTDPEALNYNSEATVDDGSCEYAEEPPTEIPGCTDPEALNYNSEATVDDGSCEYAEPDIDVTPPSTVTITYTPGTRLSPNEQINWGPATDSDSGIDGYQVQINSGDGWENIGFVQDAGISRYTFLVNRFTEGSQYRVYVIDNAGNQSAYSNVVQAN